MSSRKDEAIAAGLGDASPSPSEEWFDLLWRMYCCLTVPGLVFGVCNLVAWLVPSLRSWLAVVIGIGYVAYLAYGKMRRSRRWELMVELFLILVSATIAWMHK